MSEEAPKESGLDEGLVEAGDRERTELLNALFERHRARLLRMVRMRMHAQVKARVDASDVIQDAYIEATNRIGEYVADVRVPFFVWLRRLTGQRLMKTHRFHLDAKQRDVRRQEQDNTPAMPEVSVVAMIDMLAADATTPTQGIARAELQERILALLSELGELDREVLCMRHFEELSNEEVASELGIGKHAASKRYIRALKRLRERLGDSLTPP